MKNKKFPQCWLFFAIILVYALSRPYLACASATDITDVFNDLNSRHLSESEQSQLRQWLAQFRIFMIPGFLSEKAPKLGLQPAYTSQVQLFQELGLEFEVSNAYSGSTSAVNGKILAEKIEASPQKVILIGHSKGGFDILAAAGLSEKARNNIAGILFIQSPVLGTPVADRIKALDQLNPLKFFIFDPLGVRRAIANGADNYIWGKLGTTLEAFLDASTSVRIKFLLDHATELSQLVSQIPVLSVVSEIGPDHKTPLDSVKEYFPSIESKPNDGLVWAAPSIFPAGEYIWLKNVDHYELIFGDGSAVDWQKSQFLHYLNLLMRQKQRLSAQTAYASLRHLECEGNITEGKMKL